MFKKGTQKVKTNIHTVARKKSEIDCLLEQHKKNEYKNLFIYRQTKKNVHITFNCMLQQKIKYIKNKYPYLLIYINEKHLDKREKKTFVSRSYQ